MCENKNIHDLQKKKKKKHPSTVTGAHSSFMSICVHMYFFVLLIHFSVQSRLNPYKRMAYGLYLNGKSFHTKFRAEILSALILTH